MLICPSNASIMYAQLEFIASHIVGRGQSFLTLSVYDLIIIRKMLPKTKESEIFIMMSSVNSNRFNCGENVT